MHEVCDVKNFLPTSFNLLKAKSGKKEEGRGEGGNISMRQPDWTVSGQVFEL